ncbi:alpha/beta fold hydrolase [Arthrobacter agilis]|uniref:alpha/beta fold hydrolase n=1 Tax=Arthrobacter agilis TaxID=37921 RepID=UPI0023656582|nr:alpha/beta fold hydrolase [Arthrobacter agilis]WDF31992.1 alpha/beta fold hydrolase [Arthrobacter agilis]
MHLSRRSANPGRVRPLFVMVHGLGMSHRYYDKLQRDLLQHGDTLLVDLPGFGGTPRPEHQMSVEDYAAVLSRILDEEDAGGCVVIGHSMGAQFVTELAIDRPDLVSRLALIGPVTDIKHRSPVKHTLMLAADTLIERPLTNVMVGTAYAECGPRWYLQELPVMVKYRLDERISLVSCPVIVMRGTRDIISGHDWCERISSNAGDGQLVEIPGQPHAALRGGAAAVTAALLTAAGQQAETSSGTQTGAGVEKNRDQEAADREQHDEEAQGRAPGQGRSTASTRSFRSFTPGSGSGPEVLELRSITLGDRQCRSYFIAHDKGAACSTRDRSEPAPVFVLIHGIGMSHRYFRRLGAVLAAHGDVHLIDLPGYGWTRRPDHAASNAATADLIGKLLDDARASSCVIIGHSMGVQSATELAIERPDLVSHLILIGAAVDVEHRTVRQQALRLGVNSVLEKPLLSMVQSFDVLRCGPRWYLAQLKLAMSYPIEFRLPLAHQPVLVLRGSRDVVAGAAWSNRLAHIAHDGTAGTINGAPHAAHHSAARAVGKAITAFLGQRPS